MTWPRTQADLNALIEEHGLRDQAEAIRRLVRPCIQLRRERVQQGVLGPLDSRIGGRPHLPESMDWPMWKGRPLTHMATIRLSEASRLDREGILPKKGMLWFWADAEGENWTDRLDQNGFVRVSFSPDEDESLRPRQMPPRFSENGPRHTTQPPADDPVFVILFDSGQTLPVFDWVERTMLDQIRGSSLRSDGNPDKYYELLAAVQNFDPDGPDHQMLGYAHAIQDAMEQECAWAAAREQGPQPVRKAGLFSRLFGIAPADPDPEPPEANDWRLLLQLDSDDEQGTMWGDAGKLYFFIEESKLQECRFDRCWLVMQCG